MTAAGPQPVRSLSDHHPARALLEADVLRGLAQRPRQIAPLYFYDARGSQLFDRICELPEYYLTRTETAIMAEHGETIARCIGPGALLVEFGSGASSKTRLLLDRLPDLAAYVPVDISRSHLVAAAARVSHSYPWLEVLPVCADFTQPFELPKPVCPPRRTAIFFPGSTIGNFDYGAALSLLELMGSVAGPGGGLVIGVDLVKDAGVLTRAYDDAAGVTAEFNLNVLRRLNREFGADFDLGAFAHTAVWVPEESRIEMHLVSLQRQTVTLAGETIEFARGEHLVTEHCHKYTVNGFEALAARAGWIAQRVWLDPECRFSLHYCARP